MLSGLRDLLNLGPASERMLHAAGITTYDQLEELGSVEAFRRVREASSGVSLNLLYALEGALRDVRWDYLPPALREELRAQVTSRQV